MKLKCPYGSNELQKTASNLVKQTVKDIRSNRLIRPRSDIRSNRFTESRSLFFDEMKKFGLYSGASKDGLTALLSAHKGRVSCNNTECSNIGSFNRCKKVAAIKLPNDIQKFADSAKGKEAKQKHEHGICACRPIY